MRSRFVIFTFLLLLIPQCFAVSCRTCRGNDCQKKDVEFRTCNKFSSILPFETHLVIPKYKENLQYGCLLLEYLQGVSTEVIQNCVITENIKEFCQDIAMNIPYTKCIIEPTTNTRDKALPLYDNVDIFDDIDSRNNVAIRRNNEFQKEYENPEHPDEAVYENTELTLSTSTTVIGTHEGNHLIPSDDVTNQESEAIHTSLSNPPSTTADMDEDTDPTVNAENADAVSLTKVPPNYVTLQDNKATYMPHLNPNSTAVNLGEDTQLHLSTSMTVVAANTEKTDVDLSTKVPSDDVSDQENETTPTTPFNPHSTPADLYDDDETELTLSTLMTLIAANSGNPETVSSTNVPSDYITDRDSEVMHTPTLNPPSTLADLGGDTEIIWSTSMTLIEAHTETSDVVLQTKVPPNDVIDQDNLATHAPPLNPNSIPANLGEDAQFQLSTSMTIVAVNTENTNVESTNVPFDDVSDQEKETTRTPPSNPHSTPADLYDDTELTLSTLMTLIAANSGNPETVSSTNVLSDYITDRDSEVMHTPTLNPPSTLADLDGDTEIILSTSMTLIEAHTETSDVVLPTKVPPDDVIDQDKLATHAPPLNPNSTPANLGEDAQFQLSTSMTIVAVNTENTNVESTNVPSDDVSDQENEITYTPPPNSHSTPVDLHDDMELTLSTLITFIATNIPSDDVTDHDIEAMHTPTLIPPSTTANLDGDTEFILSTSMTSIEANTENSNVFLPTKVPPDDVVDQENMPPANSNGTLANLGEDTQFPLPTSMIVVAVSTEKTDVGSTNVPFDEVTDQENEAIHTPTPNPPSTPADLNEETEFTTFSTSMTVIAANTDNPDVVLPSKIPSNDLTDEEDKATQTPPSNYSSAPDGDNEDGLILSTLMTLITATAEISNGVSPTQVPSNVLDLNKTVHSTTTKPELIPITNQENGTTQPLPSNQSMAPANLDENNNSSSTSNITFSSVIYTFIIVIYLVL